MRHSEIELMRDSSLLLLVGSAADPQYKKIRETPPLIGTAKVLWSRLTLLPATLARIGVGRVGSPPGSQFSSMHSGVTALMSPVQTDGRSFRLSPSLMFVAARPVVMISVSKFLS